MEKTLEELLADARAARVEKYSQYGNRFRLSFWIAGVRCFTEPWTLDQLLDIYHADHPDINGVHFNDCLEEAGAYDNDRYPEGWPEVQYEYIEGRVWRTVGQTYQD